jgi:hypothetical protein
MTATPALVTGLGFGGATFAPAPAPPSATAVAPAHRPSGFAPSLGVLSGVLGGVPCVEAGLGTARSMLGALTGRRDYRSEER